MKFYPGGEWTFSWRVEVNSEAPASGNRPVALAVRLGSGWKAEPVKEGCRSVSLKVVLKEWKKLYIIIIISFDY